MVLSFSLHLVYSSYYLALIFEANEGIAYFKVLGYGLLMFYPAILAPLFLSELNELPEKTNVLTKCLSVVSRDTQKLFFTCIAISFLSMIVPALIAPSLELNQYSFGNGYAFLFILIFTLLWLIMYLSGFRPKQQKTQSNLPKFGYIIAIIILLLLSFFTYFTDLPHAWSITPIISTTGLSLSFCWYRFRTEFMDVILSQFLRIVMVITIVVGLHYFVNWMELQRFSIEIKLLLLFAFFLMLLLFFNFLNQRFKSLWQPSVRKLSVIHNELPVLLNQCTNSKSAIGKTEEYLSELFSTQVAINQTLPNAIQLVSIKGEPSIDIHLHYMRRWMPWFSEALSWVQTTGLYLQSHLKVIEALDNEHIQRLKTQEYAELAAKAELIAMQSQIRPHFLFNCLNSIHSFITYSPEKAESMIEMLAELIRGVLKMSDKNTIQLRQELALVSNYISIEKMRYGDSFLFSTEVEIECENEFIPSFSIQPLVENAIKHAVDEQFEQVTIQVKIAKNNNCLVIRVIDDGPGLVCTNSSGLGLAMQNIENRLKNLYGEFGKLTLNNADDKGAIAMIEIPLNAQDL